MFYIYENKLRIIISTFTFTIFCFRKLVSLRIIDSYEYLLNYGIYMYVYSVDALCVRGSFGYLLNVMYLDNTLIPL